MDQNTPPPDDDGEGDGVKSMSKSVSMSPAHGAPNADVVPIASERGEDDDAEVKAFGEEDEEGAHREGVEGEGVQREGAQQEDFEQDDHYKAQEDAYDSDDDDVYQDGRRGSVNHGAGGFFMDFIDDMQEGINSYLTHLEERQRGVVYDKRDFQQRERWRVCVNRLSTDAKDGPDYAVGGSSSSTAPPHQRQTFNKALGQCVPPKDVHFEPPQRLADGKPRLSFSSCFESGNLALAKSDSSTQYILLLDPDVNSMGYTQWFYFGVQGASSGMKVRFSIINMHKSGLLFGEKGMRPVVWSERSGRGWERAGTDVRFFPSEPRPGLLPEGGAKRGGFQTLAWTHTFELDEDTVFFAFHYPYTYSYQCEVLSRLMAHPYSSRFLRRGSLCRTVGGVNCETLEIISEKQAAEATPGGKEQRPLAVITSRVHPGESNASWMMHGWLQFLCSAAPEAVALREACNWLIVPMLNPDGVIHGNYRCGLAGNDLNRCFLNPHRKLHPTIWHLKERLRGTRVDLYLDLHGHSKKEGIFLYGCSYPGGDERNAEVRLLPKMCAMGSDDFKLNLCTFSTTASKESTARIVGFMQMNIMRVYTVEASFSSGGCAPPPELAHGAGGETPLYDSERAGGPAEASPEDGPGHAPDESPMAILSSLNSNSTRPPRVAHPFHRIARGSYNSLSDCEGDSDSDDGYQPPHAALRVYTDELDEESDERLTAAAAQADKLHDIFGSEMSEPAVDVAADPPREVPPGAHPCEANDFSPERLELVGPTMGLAMAAIWQLERPRITAAEARLAKAGPVLLDGSGLESRWPHTHHSRLNNAAARRALAEILGGKFCDHSDADDAGSDSNPSADERPPEELKKIHKRLVNKLKKRRPKKPEPPVQPEAPVEEETQYKTIIAFGKTMRIPIRDRRKSGRESAEGAPEGNGEMSPWRRAIAAARKSAAEVRITLSPTHTNIGERVASRHRSPMGSPHASASPTPRQSRSPSKGHIEHDDAAPPTPADIFGLPASGGPSGAARLLAALAKSPLAVSAAIAAANAEEAKPAPVRRLSQDMGRRVSADAIVSKQTLLLTPLSDVKKERDRVNGEARKNAAVKNAEIHPASPTAGGALSSRRPSVTIMTAPRLPLRMPRETDERASNASDGVEEEVILMSDDEISCVSPGAHPSSRPASAHDAPATPAGAPAAEKRKMVAATPMLLPGPQGLEFVKPVLQQPRRRTPATATSASDVGSPSPPRLKNMLPPPELDEQSARPGSARHRVRRRRNEALGAQSSGHKAGEDRLGKLIDFAQNAEAKECKRPEAKAPQTSPCVVNMHFFRVAKSSEAARAWTAAKGAAVGTGKASSLSHTISSLQPLPSTTSSKVAAAAAAQPSAGRGAGGGRSSPNASAAQGPLSVLDRLAATLRDEATAAAASAAAAAAGPDGGGALYASEGARSAAVAAAADAVEEAARVEAHLQRLAAASAMSPSTFDSDDSEDDDNYDTSGGFGVLARAALGVGATNGALAALVAQHRASGARSVGGGGDRSDRFRQQLSASGWMSPSSPSPTEIRPSEVGFAAFASSAAQADSRRLPATARARYTSLEQQPLPAPQPKAQPQPAYSSATRVLGQPNAWGGAASPAPEDFSKFRGFDALPLPPRAGSALGRPIVPGGAAASPSNAFAASAPPVADASSMAGAMPALAARQPSSQDASLIKMPSSTSWALSSAPREGAVKSSRFPRRTPLWQHLG